jgi:hypothetical protein
LFVVGVEFIYASKGFAKAQAKSNLLCSAGSGVIRGHWRQEMLLFTRVQIQVAGMQGKYFRTTLLSGLRVIFGVISLAMIDDKLHVKGDGLR